MPAIITKTIFTASVAFLFIVAYSFPFPADPFDTRIELTLSTPIPWLVFGLLFSILFAFDLAEPRRWVAALERRAPRQPA